MAFRSRGLGPRLQRRRGGKPEHEADDALGHWVRQVGDHIAAAARAEAIERLGHVLDDQRLQRFDARRQKDRRQCAPDPVVGLAVGALQCLLDRSVGGREALPVAQDRADVSISVDNPTALRAVIGDVWTTAERLVDGIRIVAQRRIEQIGRGDDGHLRTGLDNHAMLLAKIARKARRERAGVGAEDRRRSQSRSSCSRR